MSLAGMYLRMEDEDPTKPFRNKQRFCLSGSTMTLHCKKKSSVKLTVEWIAATSFKVNLSPFNRSWGEVIFHKHSLDGVEGLLEEGNHGGTFWKRSADLADTEAREHRSQ